MTALVKEVAYLRPPPRLGNDHGLIRIIPPLPLAAVAHRHQRPFLATTPQRPPAVVEVAVMVIMAATAVRVVESYWTGIIIVCSVSMSADTRMTWSVRPCRYWKP